MFELTPVPAMLIDELGIIQRMNSKACAELGYAADEVVEKHVRFILPKTVQNGRQCHLRTKLEIGHNTPIVNGIQETPFECKDGTIKLCILEVTELMGGSRRHLACIFHGTAPLPPFLAMDYLTNGEWVAENDDDQRRTSVGSESGWQPIDLSRVPPYSTKADDQELRRPSITTSLQTRRPSISDTCRNSRRLSVEERLIRPVELVRAPAVSPIKLPPAATTTAVTSTMTSSHGSASNRESVLGISNWAIPSPAPSGRQNMGAPGSAAATDSSDFRRVSINPSVAVAPTQPTAPTTDSIRSSVIRPATVTPPALSQTPPPSADGFSLSNMARSVLSGLTPSIPKKERKISSMLSAETRSAMSPQQLDEYDRLASEAMKERGQKGRRKSLARGSISAPASPQNRGGLGDPVMEQQLKKVLEATMKKDSGGDQTMVNDSSAAAFIIGSGIVI